MKRALIFSMIVMRVRKAIAEAAMFIFLVTVTPVYAISEIESRPIRRTVQTEMFSMRMRRRALTRRYGTFESFGTIYQLAA